MIKLNTNNTVYITDEEWEEFTKVMDREDAPVHERLVKLLTDRAPWESDDESTK